MPARVSFYRPTGHSRRQGRGQQQFDHDVFEGLPIRRWDRQWTWVSRSNPPPRPEPQLPLPKDTHLLTPLAQSLLQAARSGSLAQVHHQPAQEDEEDDVLSVSSPGSFAGSIAYSRDGSVGIGGGRESTTPDPNAPGATKRLFQTNRWSCIPRPVEPPEPTYLARMPDSQIRRTRKIQHRLNGTKVVFVDEIEEPETSPPNPTAAAVAASEAKAAEAASATQTPKKRHPPPRRKPGRGRKPGMKKGQSISSLHGVPQTPNAREGSVLHTDGDMEMLDADDSLIHTPASRVESDSAGSTVSTPDVRASAGPALPELPALTPQTMPAEPPRSVPELPMLDVEMTNSSDSLHPLPASIEQESHVQPHPLSRQITPPPQSAVEPTVKIETPPVEVSSIPEEPVPMEPKETDPATAELAKQDIMQQEAAEHDLAQEAPVEPKQEPLALKSASPPLVPSPARTLSPAPVAEPVVAPVTAPSPKPTPLSPVPASSPLKESAAPTSLPTLVATPELAPVLAPVLAPSPVPAVAVEAPPSPPAAPPALLEVTATLPPVSVASPPSTTQAHAQRAVSPKPAQQEEAKPETISVPSHPKVESSSIAALLNGTPTPPAAPVAEKPLTPAAPSPLAKMASPAPADEVKIPDAISPHAAAAGPSLAEAVESAPEKEAEARVQTPPETSS